MSAGPDKIRRQGSTKNGPAFLILDKLPQRDYFYRQQCQVLAMDGVMVLDAQPANMERLRVILMMPLDVVRVAAYLAWWSLKFVVAAKHIEPTPTQLFIRWVLRFQRHNSNNITHKSLIKKVISL